MTKKLVFTWLSLPISTYSGTEQRYALLYLLVIQLGLEDVSVGIVQAGQADMHRIVHKVCRTAVIANIQPHSYRPKGRHLDYLAVFGSLLLELLAKVDFKMGGGTYVFCPKLGFHQVIVDKRNAVACVKDKSFCRNNDPALEYRFGEFGRGIGCDYQEVITDFSLCISHNRTEKH